MAMPFKKTGFPGLILAGGASRRMGEDKALVKLGGKTLIEHAACRLSPQVSEVWINRMHAAHMPADFLVIPDTLEGRQGPLAGILAGLSFMKRRNHTATHLLSVPIDTPFMPADLATRLASQVQTASDIVLAQSMGRQHPVIGLWPVSLSEDLEAWLRAADTRRVFDYLARHPHRFVDFEAFGDAQDPFFNINSPADLAWAQDRVGQQGS